MDSHAQLFYALKKDPVRLIVNQQHPELVVVLSDAKEGTAVGVEKRHSPSTNQEKWNIHPVSSAVDQHESRFYIQNKSTGTYANVENKSFDVNQEVVGSSEKVAWFIKQSQREGLISAYHISHNENGLFWSLENSSSNSKEPNWVIKLSNDKDSGKCDWLLKSE
ncbi:hypothetical protein VNI00_009117 [Paramarasmius palmivorus]|uniref:Ricin B lectin domain-containing protein n=1 Tax=Paramarasmius palmivorus TaxID=297713 RepID=A0AAW0CS77_9AGAR